MDHESIPRHVYKKIGHHGAVYGLASNPNSPSFYSVAGDGWIVKWSAASDQLDGLLLGETNTKLYSIAISEGEELLVTGGIDKYVYWIDIVGKKILSKSSFHRGSIFGICFLSSDYLATVGGDGVFCVWNCKTRQPIFSTQLSHQGLRCLTYHAATHKIYVGASDNHMYILDASTFDVIDILKNSHQNSVFSLCTISDQYLISGCRDAHLMVRSLSELKILYDMEAHRFTINKIIHIPSMQLLVTASRDKTIRLWDSERFVLLKTLDYKVGGHVHSVNNIIWLSQTNQLVSAGDDQKLIQWDLGSI